MAGPLDDLQTDGMTPMDLINLLGPKRVRSDKYGATETEMYDINDIVAFLEFTRKRKKKTSSAMQRVGFARLVNKISEREID